MRTILACFAMLITASAAYAADNAKKDREPPDELSNYEETGDVELCIRLNRIRSTKALDDYTILFRMRGSNPKYYVSKLKHRCPRLKFEDSFSYRTSLNSLCNTDIITVLDTGAGGIRPQASCGLGKFHALKKLDKKAQQDNWAKENQETDSDG